MVLCHYFGLGSAFRQTVPEPFLVRDWVHRAIELTLNLILQGQLEIIRAPIAVEQAHLLSERLQAALDRASSGS